MNLKTSLYNIFSYKPNLNNDFSLSESPNNISEKKINQNIYLEYDKNINFIKDKYSLLINSDIVLKEFIINIKNKTFKAFLLFIDGMINSESINSSVLEPLLLKNSIRMNTPSSEIKKINNIKKFDLKEFLLNHLIQENSITIEDNFENTFSKINSGYTALFVESLNIAICIEAKKLAGRSITTPQSESIVRGSHESYIENIRTNTSLLRKIINNENLIIENTTIGEITKTQVAICYMKNITNDDLVSEVKFRLNNLKIDNLLSSGQLENLIKDNSNNIFPEIIATERPDRTCNYILNGRIAIIVNGSPYALIVPAIMIDFFSSSEDMNLNYIFSNFLKAIRMFALFIATFLPGIYVAVTMYHQEFIPDELLYAMVSARENIPFSIIFEIIIMEIAFELIREAGIRVPSPLRTNNRYSWCFNSWGSSCRSKYSKSYTCNNSCRYCCF